MSIIDDLKNKAEEAKVVAKDIGDKVSKEADIAKQRIEGEIDKAKGDDVKGEAKIKTSEVRDKLK